MTMTNDYDDEESFLIDKVMSARHELKIKKEAAAMQRLSINQSETYLNECEQALLDYYAASGVTTSEVGKFKVIIGNSKSVEVADIDSVPEKYIRTKITKEVNKALIKAEGLEANNWLSYTITPTLTIKNIGE